MRESKHCDLSKLIEESACTREESPDSMIGEMLSDDSLTNIMANSIEIDQGIVGTNSSLTDDYQMFDQNLKWLNTIIKAKERSGNKIKVNKKLLKYLPNLKIIKNLIYLVDEDKFGIKR